MACASLIQRQVGILPSGEPILLSHLRVERPWPNLALPPGLRQASLSWCPWARSVRRSSFVKSLRRASRYRRRPWLAWSAGFRVEAGEAVEMPAGVSSTPEWTHVQGLGPTRGNRDRNMSS